MSLSPPCLRPVLILGGIAALLAGCRDQNNDLEWWRNERLKIELSQHLELLKYRLALRNGDEVGQLASIQSAKARNQGTLTTLRTTQKTLTEEIHSLHEQLAAAAQQTQQRNRANAIGQYFESLTLARGRTFHNVYVQNVSDSGVSIRHAHGTARLRYSDLSNEQQTFFGLNETSALAAEKKEAEAAASYERQLASHLRDTRQIQQKKSWTSNTNQRQTRRSHPPLVDQAAKSTSTSSFRIWRSRPRTYYYTPMYRYYGPVYRDIIPIQRPIPRPKPKKSSSS